MRFIRARRIEPESIDRAGILDTTVDLGCQVVAGSEDTTAALDGKYFQTQIGETRLLR